MEGVLKVFGSRQMVEGDILHSQPIAAILYHKNKLYKPYCPIGHANIL